MLVGLAACVQTTLEGTVLVEIEVQPGSSRQGVIGFNEWRGKLQVAVKAEAQKGKANHAVCNVLSTIFSKQVTVVSGHTTRQKKVSIEGLTANQIISKLEGLVES
ncbi:MAG: YggU family protein [Euryarchaeota archaeon]|nr:YggU family protein [Euryarchaeota archaeon]